MYQLIQGENTIGKYCTRQEANYYKTKYPKSKVVARYEICDLNKHMLAENEEIYAKSPADAIKKYIIKNNLKINVQVDLSNTGRFVVLGNRTSKVYKEAAKEG